MRSESVQVRFEESQDIILCVVVCAVATLVPVSGSVGARRSRTIEVEGNDGDEVP